MRVGRNEAQRQRHAAYVNARVRGLPRADARAISGVSRATAQRIDRDLRANGVRIGPGPSPQPRQDRSPGDDRLQDPQADDGPAGVKLSRFVDPGGSRFVDPPLVGDFEDDQPATEPATDQRLKQLQFQSDLIQHIDAARAPKDDYPGDPEEPTTGGGFGDPMPSDHPAAWKRTWSAGDRRISPDNSDLFPTEASFMGQSPRAPEEQPRPGSKAWNVRAHRLRTQRSPKPYKSFLGVVGP